MNVCPVHQVPWKIVPAGISKKTGRWYPSFATCQIPECQLKPEEGVVETGAVPTATAQTSELNGVRQGVKEAVKEVVKTDDQVWEAKDRMSMAQTSLNKAVDTYSAELSYNALNADYPIRKVEDLRDEYFNWLLSKKEGK